MSDAGGVLVEMAGIGKAYGGVQACRGVDFTVRAGEVHALLIISPNEATPLTAVVRRCTTRGSR